MNKKRTKKSVIHVIIKHSSQNSIGQSYIFALVHGSKKKRTLPKIAEDDITSTYIYLAVVIKFQYSSKNACWVVFIG